MACEREREKGVTPAALWQGVMHRNVASMPFPKGVHDGLAADDGISACQRPRFGARVLISLDSKVE